MTGKEEPWLGPFTIHEIINNKICQLKNDVKVLKTKVLISNMKKYFEYDGQKLNEDTYAEELKTSEKNIMSRKDKIPTGPKTRMSYPVGKTCRQQTKRRTLKLNFSQQVTNETILAKFLTVPSEIKHIFGDGNCLYRSLSYWITGDEDYHFAIRQHVCEVKKISNIERYIGGKENMKKYLEQKTIENDGNINV
ncbi:unnamed protein product [Macrosiphum euphorbiae]|uniref:OTU domain-containing protein n=1 Tax=Macrosiphum euphorbiae TaxID=13131 RepID=A0AAV0XJZ6_9HEMI|nr:unnamed protein product [Macrosiphum euphorbiae]